MPYRSWLLISALGLISATASAQEIVAPPEELPAVEQSQARQESSEVTPSVPEPISAAPDQSNSGHDDGSSEAESEHAGEMRSSILGDGSAEWAMVLLTLASVIISGLGVFLLKRTLEATLRTIREGEKATSAAVTASVAAHTANEIMERAQRPWLDVYIPPQDIPDIGTEAITFCVALEINNRSDFIAENWCCCAAVAYSDPDEAGWDFEKHPVQKTASELCAVDFENLDRNVLFPRDTTGIIYIKLMPSTFPKFETCKPRTHGHLGIFLMYSTGRGIGTVEIKCLLSRKEKAVTSDPMGPFFWDVTPLHPFKRT